MNKKINRVRLYIKDNEVANKLAIKLKKELVDNGFEINDKIYDLAISIGGDGTFLKMIHANNFNSNIIYTGLNAGSLGYLTEFNKVDDAINCLQNNNFTKKNFSILKTKIFTDEKIVNNLSLNEFVIKETDLSVLRCDVFINNMLLEHFVGDGLIINTPIGSTGYNLSLNGGIIDNDLNVFSLTPIAPINNSIFKSLTNNIVLSNNKKITLLFDNKKDLSIIIDGKVLNINNINKIEISLSSNKVSLLEYNNHNFISKIYNKILN